MKLIKGGKQVEEQESAELQYVFVCLFDEDDLVSIGNGAVGLLEMPTDRRLALFKEVALIDPDFIACSSVGEVLIFADMEIIIVGNLNVELCDECRELLKGETE